MNKFVTLSACIALTACGGSNGPTETDPGRDLSSASSFVGTGVIVSYNQSEDEYTLSRASVDTIVSGDPSMDIGTFDGADNGTGVGFFVSETDNSSIQLSVFSGEAGPTSYFSRSRTPTTVPTMGSTMLTGDYVGVVTNAVSYDVDLIISGDAELTFDFEASTTQGSITGRVARDPSTNDVLVGVDVGDVTLNSIEFTDPSGRFAGGSNSATGGSIGVTTEIGSPTTTDLGYYNGILGGITGDEAIGGVTITHTPVGGGDGRQERGVFALGH